MLEIVNELIRKFNINIRQIVNNSDNTLEDVKNESVLVLIDNYDKIKRNERVFINELKKRCLKFNKYGKRIESKERWGTFNNREEVYISEVSKPYEIDEDKLCQIVDIKNIIGEYNYDFLICYFSEGVRYTSQKYKISEPTTRKRVSNLIDKLRGELC